MQTYASEVHTWQPSDFAEHALQNIVIRARQDHASLKAELQAIYNLTCAVRTYEDQSQINEELRRLFHNVKAFVLRWNGHVQWEEDELLPYAAAYYGEEPDLFAYMEQENELAEQYILAFLHTLDRSVIPVEMEDARRMASYLLQAYAFLKNRFEEEDEILRALTLGSHRIGS